MTTSLTTRDELFALRFALPPLLVWGLSLLVFEVVAFDLERVGSALPAAMAAAAQTVEPAVEASARILWGASLLVFAVVALAVVAYAAALLKTRLSWRGRWLYVAAAGALCAAALGHAALSGEMRNAFSMIYHFTADSLAACGCYAGAQLRLIDAAVTALNVVAALVPPFALIAGCSVLVVPRGDDAQALTSMQRQMATLKILLAGGSALLVTGVVHQTLWQRWPVVLAGGDSELLHFIESMGIYWGATYSLLIVAFYVPPAWVMNRRAHAILAAHPDLAGGDAPSEWLARHGLSGAALKQLPQLAAMLAPLLAGPLGSSIASFGDGLLPS